jgi:DNA topoisomerase IA
MSSGTITNPRLEIEEIMRSMVSAVDFVVATTQTSNKRKQGRPNKNSAVSTSDSDDGSVVKSPRKRGRPKKQLPTSVQDAQQEESSTLGMPASETEEIASG